MIVLVLPLLYCLLITHLNGRIRSHYFSWWSPCFGFLLCPCYNRRTHYPTLEEPGDQNIKACENQGKHCELSDHWKSKKQKKLGDGAKKTKILTEIQVLTKKCTERVFKKTRKRK